ncbi:MAG: hypothetical protein KAS12_00530, partial [Candidatus Aenigmarchaeota archaeon]|nr:hypothetical protein [Candidatus Aenigmarchaeota archaeon]
MPYAVTHILFAIVSLDLIRDYLMKHKHAWTNKYIFAAGVGGILPDAVNMLTFITGDIYRAWTHNLLFLSLFLVAAEIFRRNKNDHKYALALSFGIGTHLLLDLVILG